MAIIRPLACAASLLAAPFLFVQGYSNARISPAPVGLNGFWQASVSRAYLQVEFDEARQSVEYTVLEGGKDFARSAYRAEPLATDAIYVFAISERSGGNDVAMERFLDMGLSLDKRSVRLNTLKLETSAMAGDYLTVFDTFDRLSLISPRVTREIMPVFSSALQESTAVEAVANALDDEPRWASDFWSGVRLDGTTLAQVSDLRSRTSFGTTSESDTRLFEGFVEAQKFAEAFEFWDAHLSADSDPIAFRADSEFAPLGWTVTSQGDRSWSQRGDGLYAAYVEDRTEGELSRQLVRLRPGEYQFNALVEPRSQAPAFSASLECAESEETVGAARSFDGAMRWIVPGTCMIYWLIVEGTAWERSSPLRAEISDMRFGRIN